MLAIPFRLDESHFFCFVLLLLSFFVCLLVFFKEFKYGDKVKVMKENVKYICLLYCTSYCWKLQMSGLLCCVINHKFLKSVYVDKSIWWHCHFFRTLFLKLKVVVHTCLAKPVQCSLWNFYRILVYSRPWSHPESIPLPSTSAFLF
jgi:hypothetical protein